MKTALFSLALVGWAFAPTAAQQTLRFERLDSLLHFAETRSVSVQNSDAQVVLAKWTKLAAQVGAVNPRANLTFSMTDNVKLPVNFIPAEAFGGPAGTYREVTLGQPYVSNLTLSPQIELINPQAWARIKSAELNEQLVAVQRTIAQQALAESLTAAYFNLRSIRVQTQILRESAALMDSIETLIRAKYEAGLLREQDWNNAQINRWTILDKIQQSEASAQKQLLAIRLLCELPEQTALEVVPSEPLPAAAQDLDQLSVGYSAQAKQAELQTKLAAQEHRVSKLAFMPTLSFTGGFAWQENSKKRFFDPDSRWIPTHSLGLRLTVPIVPEATRFTQLETARVNYRLSQLAREHTARQREQQSAQIRLEAQQNAESWRIAQEIGRLKRANFEKTRELHAEGLASTELLLNQLNEWINAQLSEQSALINLNFQRAKAAIYP